MLAAVCTSYNEADIITKTISHLLGNGVDRIWCADASTDATRLLLAQFPQVTIIDDNIAYHSQPHWIEALTESAREENADWVIPFDADEFWYAQDGRTIKEALADLPETTVVCVAAPFQHFDWEHRDPDHAAMSKMMFRPQPGITVANGNHRVGGYDGDLNFETLAIREVMFRSLEHMTEKSRDRTERLDPALPDGDGQHQKDIHAMSSEAKAAEWEARRVRATVVDPIPYRGVECCPRCYEILGPGHESYPCVDRRKW